MRGDWGGGWDAPPLGLGPEGGRDLGELGLERPDPGLGVEDDLADRPAVVVVGEGHPPPRVVGALHVGVSMRIRRGDRHLQETE